MVKHTQTIRRQQPTNCLSVSDHFVGLVLKGLTIILIITFIVSFILQKWINLCLLCIRILTSFIFHRSNIFSLAAYSGRTL